jgi:cyanophycin synthetase
MLRAGLGFSQCDVGAVLNVSSDHLGLQGINTLEQLAEVKRLIAEVTRDSVVLNADDPICVDMVPYITAPEICYVSMKPDNEVIRAHKEKDGRAVVLEEDDHGELVVLYEKGRRVVFTRPRLIPATLEGKAIHNTQNAMFALAMARCLGASIDNIEQGLRTFDSSFYQTPGRLNIYDEHPFKVILDYGHNPAAIEAMVALVDRMNPSGKRRILMTAPGDRRDQDMIDLARATAGHFDHYVCHDEDHRRGREEGEVAGILADALRDADVSRDQIEVIADEEQAVAALLASAKPGDLLLLFADDITRTWKQVIYFEPS